MKITPTEQHLQASYEAIRAHGGWPGWAFAAVMADQVKSRVIRARATVMALAEHNAHHSHERVLVRRHVPGTNRWCTTTHPGARTVPTLIEEE